jgi:anti-sigma B factor antagonist
VLGCASPAPRRRITIQTRSDRTLTIIQVHGTLTAALGERGLRAAVRAAVDAGARAVVINLQDAAAIDSSGVSDLASAHMLLSGNGGALKICCLSQKLKDVFVVTRLNTVFDLYETEAEAVASARAVDASGQQP